MNNILRFSKPLEFTITRVFPTNQPFSNFDFILENEYSNCQSLPRILSQARQLGFQTLVDESIRCVGFAEEEDKDFKQYEKNFIASKLQRLSFFRKSFKTVQEIQQCDDNDFLGYAILKGNQFSGRAEEEWNIFESVIRPSEKPNNYNHTTISYEVLVYSKCFKISGNLYCAQNARTNSCAHAALRSVIAATGVGDISYAEINSILKRKKSPFKRRKELKGLSVKQVKKVLDDIGIRCKLDYVTKTSGGVSWTEKEYQELMWIQNRIYKSIEVGYPVFMAFTWKEEKEPAFGKETEGHAIAILGHTFSDDTWVPRAATQYFTVSRDVGYVSSEEWTSAYIGHDESLGSNYHIPRWYLINNPNITSIHVLATLPNESILDPIQVEVIAIFCLYKIIAQLKSMNKNPWFNRLEGAVEKRTVVLRSVFLSGEKYLDHLVKIRGWNDKKSEYINSTTIESLRKELKGVFWIIEVSLQELFPTNRRKLGEIVLKANIPIKKGDYSNFVFARLPGMFVSPEVRGELTDVRTTPSGIISHTELIEVHR